MHVVRWKFGERIESEPCIVAKTKRVGSDQIEIRVSQFPREVPPSLNRLLRVWNQCRTIDGQDRATVDLEIAFICEILSDVAEEGKVIFRTMLLGDQHLVLAPIPTAGPVLLRPT